MILLQEKDTQPLMMGVCDQCAQYNNNELVTLVRDQFGTHYGLNQQTPTDSAKVELEFPSGGVEFNIAGVSFFMPGRGTQSVPAGPNVFVDLLEAGRLREFMALRRGISNCHGITSALYRDLDDAGWAQHFALKRGSCEVLKSGSASADNRLSVHAPRNPRRDLPRASRVWNNARLQTRWSATARLSPSILCVPRRFSRVRRGCPAGSSCPLGKFPKRTWTK
jgi:hypothetical protein